MSDYKKVFVINIHNEDDGGNVVYTTVATTEALARADALETIRCWGFDEAESQPGAANSIFRLSVLELNLIEA